MGLEHLHGRIITAALGIPSCGCASGNGFGDEYRIFGGLHIPQRSALGPARSTSPASLQKARARQTPR